VLEREDLIREVEAGLTEREIAERLGVTKMAVHPWLGAHGLRTQVLSKLRVRQHQGAHGSGVDSERIGE
jgi:predicted transcriptional regulator